MDRERIMLVLDSLFQSDSDVVPRERILERVDTAEELDPESRNAMRALVRETYTRQQLVDELRSLGRNVPVGGGSVFGGAG